MNRVLAPLGFTIFLISIFHGNNALILSNTLVLWDNALVRLESLPGMR